MLRSDRLHGVYDLDFSFGHGNSVYLARIASRTSGFYLEVARGDWGKVIRSIRVRPECTAWASRQDVLEAIMSFLKKTAETDAKRQREASAKAKAFAQAYPAVFEYLTATEYDGGEDRITSTLLVFVEDGEWKACLNDRDAERTLWASGDDLMGLVGSLDAHLQSGAPEWRGQGSRKGGKKKR